MLILIVSGTTKPTSQDISKDNSKNVSNKKEPLSDEETSSLDFNDELLDEVDDFLKEENIIQVDPKDYDQII